MLVIEDKFRAAWVENLSEVRHPGLYVIAEFRVIR